MVGTGDGIQLKAALPGLVVSEVFPNVFRVFLGFLVLGEPVLELDGFATPLCERLVPATSGTCWVVLMDPQREIDGYCDEELRSRPLCLRSQKARMLRSKCAGKPATAPSASISLRAGQQRSSRGTWQGGGVKTGSYLRSSAHMKVIRQGIWRKQWCAWARVWLSARKNSVVRTQMASAMGERGIARHLPNITPAVCAKNSVPEPSREPLSAVDPHRAEQKLPRVQNTSEFQSP